MKVLTVDFSLKIFGTDSSVLQGAHETCLKEYGLSIGLNKINGLYIGLGKVNGPLCPGKVNDLIFILRKVYGLILDLDR